MAVGAGQTGHQSCRGFAHAVAIGVIIGKQHFGDALQGRRLGGCGVTARAGHKHMHLAQTRDGRQRLGNLIGRQMPLVHIRNQQNGHQITPASSLSFAISSATEPTLTPALRPTGSTVLTTVRRGATSTP